MVRHRAVNCQRIVDNNVARIDTRGDFCRQIAFIAKVNDTLTKP